MRLVLAALAALAVGLVTATPAQAGVRYGGSYHSYAQGGQGRYHGRYVYRGHARATVVTAANCPCGPACNCGPACACPTAAPPVAVVPVPVPVPAAERVQAPACANGSCAAPGSTVYVIPPRLFGRTVIINNSPPAGQNCCPAGGCPK